jgi:hypothetical protein
MHFACATHARRSTGPSSRTWPLALQDKLRKSERKTLFYTEVNSGLKVGDRVFIINGNYDSDLLIKQNKYKSKNINY